MDKGTKLYQELIDTLVNESKSCAYANWALTGEAKSVSDQHTSNLNQLFSKLTTEERETLAKYALDAYSCGIYDTLCLLEWYISCKRMEISVEGKKLPTTKFEGLGNDFIGRREGWEWPER